MPPPTQSAAGTTFVLKLGKVDHDEAERCCNGLCGHLAGYISQDEQYEVR